MKLELSSVCVPGSSLISGRGGNDRFHSRVKEVDETLQQRIFLSLFALNFNRLLNVQQKQLLNPTRPLGSMNNAR